MRTDILRAAKVRLASRLQLVVAFVSVVERVHVILLVGVLRRGEGSRVVDVVFPPLFFFVGHLAPFYGEFGRGICKQRERVLGLSLSASFAR